MIFRRIIIATVVILPLAALADSPVAVVAKYLPPKAELAVERAGGGDAIAGLGTPLYAGDTLKVSDGGSVQIAYADGAREDLDGPTAFTVPEKEEMGMAARIYSRLQTMLGREYRQGSNLATRGPGSCEADSAPLEAPVLGSTTMLSNSHENIALAWIGGCAPYSLSVNGSGNADIRLADLKRPLTRVGTEQLSVGEYTLTIRDARPQDLSVKLIVVDGLPDGPIEHASIDSELDAVAYAAWLANHEDGYWRLESFQQLRPWIRAGGAMAGTYGDLVMWGDPSLETDVSE